MVLWNLSIHGVGPSMFLSVWKSTPWPHHASNHVYYPTPLEPHPKPSRPSPFWPVPPGKKSLSHSMREAPGAICLSCSTLRPLANDMSVTIPKDLIGTVYAVVTTNSTIATDPTTVAYAHSVIGRYMDIEDLLRDCLFHPSLEFSPWFFYASITKDLVKHFTLSFSQFLILNLLSRSVTRIRTINTPPPWRFASWHYRLKVVAKGDGNRVCHSEISLRKQLAASI